MIIPFKNYAETIPKTMLRILPSCPCLMPLITQLELKPQLATLGQDKRIGALKMCPKMVEFCLKVGPHILTNFQVQPQT